MRTVDAVQIMREEVVHRADEPDPVRDRAGRRQRVARGGEVEVVVGEQDRVHHGEQEAGQRQHVRRHPLRTQLQVGRRRCPRLINRSWSIVMDFSV